MRNRSTRTRLEVATALWALAVVIAGGIHLTASSSVAYDCGEACAVACSTFDQQCSEVYEICDGGNCEGECDGGLEWYGETSGDSCPSSGSE